MSLAHRPESLSTENLKTLLKQRILVVDGAMGTAIQARDLGPDDFGGLEYEGCNENLVLTRPDVISDIHQGYLDAGGRHHRDQHLWRYFRRSR